MATSVKTPSKTITDTINDEYRNFSMYTIENRGIPSCIDGLKSVQRLLVYSGLQNPGTHKVTELGAIARYGYEHGESSAYDALVAMAQSWSNNAPIFIEDGNFGSRLVPDAAAPRYLTSGLAKTFKTYFQDFEVCDPRPHGSSMLTPISYLPIIPWVLVNGISGIAVGFATKILPRDPVNVAHACIAHIKGKPIDPVLLDPKFPSFKGLMESKGDGKYETVGLVQKEGRNKYLITEVPVGHDRVSYYEVLERLIEEGSIDDFEDHCNSTGFRFIVTASLGQREKIEKDPIKFFELRKKHSENITTLDEAGHLRLFDNPTDVVKYFCDYRVTKIRQKIDYDIAQTEEAIRKTAIRLKFVTDVIDRKFDLRTATRAATETHLRSIGAETGDIAALVGIAFLQFTVEEVEKLRQLLTELQKTLEALDNTDEKQEFLSRLVKITKA